MKLRNAILATALCLQASASILPGPLFSGDIGGFNTMGPNIAAPNALIVPGGITSVSFSGIAAPGQVVGFADQWNLTDGEMPNIQWWSTGPTTIWVDGGLVGIVSADATPGPHTGIIDLSAELPGFHYFEAFVQTQDGKDAFAYGTPTPEPGTVWMFLAGPVMAWAVLSVRREGK
jgi:hypothetical protein